MTPPLVLIALLLGTAVGRQSGLPVGEGKTLPVVHLTAPQGGWSVDRMLLVAGSISDETINPVQVSINGDRYLMRTYKGGFSRKFPAAAGKNIVTVLATNHGGTTSAQATAYAQVPAVPLKVILTSDTDGVYTDLHIYEPTADGLHDGQLDVTKMQHVYWADTASPSGGTFFLNEQGQDFDQPGYGPYLYVHRAPPLGVYLIATNYWPSGDVGHTLATLNIAMYEGTPREVRRQVQTPLATPGTTRVLAWVKVTENGGTVYVPAQDSQPEGEGWPKNLATAVDQLQSAGVN